MHEHRELRHLITPGNYLVSLGRILSDEQQRQSLQRIRIGTDAHVSPRLPGDRPRLLVLMVGETVRAQNWGLNGSSGRPRPNLPASHR